MDKPPPPRPAVIVHGGAWAIPDAEWQAHRDGVARACAAAWAVLSANGQALDAVEAAVTRMEEDPTFDAGVGSVLTRDGVVEMDAAVMDGRDRGVGAVACVRTVRSPFRAARSLLNAEHAFLVGEGAERWARERGLATCDNADFVVARERTRFEARRAGKVSPDPKAAFERPTSGPAPLGPPPSEGPRGTVGCVAIDRGGNIAAGGSTGGTPGKRSGRIGDTPIPGAGLWADNREGGAACSGWGEGILRMGLARTAVSHLREASAQDAAWLAIREMDARVAGLAGVIILSRDGSIGFGFNTPRMAISYMDGELAEPWVIGTRGA
jgi:beta-aspartyl-peptidase (threonine type)